MEVVAPTATETAASWRRNWRLPSRPRPGLTASVKPRRDRNAPYRYRIRGRLILPSGVASTAYSFVRFSGAALARWLDGVLGEQISMHLPFWVGAAAVLLGAGVLAATRSHLIGIDVEEEELEEITDQATALTDGSDS